MRIQIFIFSACKKEKGAATWSRIVWANPLWNAERIMSESSVEKRLRELGLKLPAPAKAAGAYIPALRVGNLVITSGQLPWKGDQPACSGKLGSEIELALGYEAARVCALNALAQCKVVLGDLDQIRRVVRLEGYVQCGPGFEQHAKVLDGASDLINAVFGERGVHTRTAVGVNEMPFNAPVQLALWAEVE
jgi:enamine deaminase RidA (YjgF/YER057c/UK114 family)